jgi:hypothetical protein
MQGEMVNVKARGRIYSANITINPIQQQIRPVFFKKKTCTDGILLYQNPSPQTSLRTKT